LPVRENEDVFVWMSMFGGEADHARHMRALDQSSSWRDATRELAPHLVGVEECLRLSPTARSALHS
jgi:hypothetical protein